jgi:MATE family multidrug resistance protein
LSLGAWFERHARPGADARREVSTLAWPIAVALLGDTAMGLVDTALVGGLGADALGGVGVATVLTWLNYAVVFGVMRGVKVASAHALGEGRGEYGLAYARAGALLGLAAGAAVFALGRDVTWALAALHIHPAMVPYARAFMAARTALAPLTCALAALVQWRQGVGDSRTPMRITLSGNVLNAALAWTLIHGHFGLPRLGVAGAGYATAIAEGVNALRLGALWLAAWRARAPDPTAPSLAAALRRVCAVGVPTGLQFGLETLAFTAFTAILGGLGATEVAAHQVALAVIRVSFLPGVAVSESASVLVGRALGRHDADQADRMARAALQVAIAFMAGCGAVFFVGGGAIARVFTDDPALVETVRRLLVVAAVFQVLDGANIVLRGALRGAKDVRWAALVGIATMWTCVPGAAWLFGRTLGYGVVGAWLGFVGETTIGAALLWWRWTRGGWRAHAAPRSAAAAW